MKKTYFLVVLLLFARYASAQKNVIDWSFSSEKISEKLFEVKLTATLKKGWHIYSGSPGEGPAPTSITFVKSPVLELRGSIKERGKIRSEKSDIFNSEIKYYEDSLILTQKVLVRFNIKTTISGKVHFMVCDNKQCLPPETVEFSIKLV